MEKRVGKTDFAIISYLAKCKIVNISCISDLTWHTIEYTAVGSGWKVGKRLKLEKKQEKNIRISNDPNTNTLIITTKNQVVFENNAQFAEKFVVSKKKYHEWWESFCCKGQTRNFTEND